MLFEVYGYGAQTALLSGMWIRDADCERRGMGRAKEQHSMILFEDKEIIVCHKPAGIPVQSARLGQKDMVSILNNDLAYRGEDASVRVVHRLDQPVEGVIVFARTGRAAAGLGEQIQKGSMEKRYQAVCCVQNPDWKQVPGESGCDRGSKQDGENRVTLVDYLVKDGRTNTSFIGKKGQKEAKRAELTFEVLAERRITLSERDGGSNLLPEEHERAHQADKMYLLADICLKTGRHHQIRVQMSHAGLPLYGDRKYNGTWEDYVLPVSRGQDGQGEKSGESALALCAVSLAFRHPSSGKRMEFQVKPKAKIFQIFEETR